MSAARFLRDVISTGVVLEDTEDLAFAAYRVQLNFSGQPGMGDQFLEWFMRERWLGNLVQRVSNPQGGSILELLPASLASFDRDDHKWICIYLAGEADVIVNASDSDWVNGRVRLQAEGINVLELLAGN